ncbi:hypothetical protein CMQ_1808 [Grosmannia clavigera kw1407]|uniref:Uncharacterized protein n=1 Tax=Grosmannia clavigera (strain kw1407 / UAMH 11150) TaxID=655863 RepID=F0XAW9_GROCL|nr:uncharacterized protein CMQ_1808 [Grosmannia clavigera kw1407]EFX05172.1 hypothetical protein CMQ_1808 [Grosmannia clavigera kw1407]
MCIFLFLLPRSTDLDSWSAESISLRVVPDAVEPPEIAAATGHRLLRYLPGCCGYHAAKLSPIVQDMFDGEMRFLDRLYDKTAGYLYNFYYPLAAGPHETRSSVWFAVGLLQRNSGDDRTNAVKIINNVIAGQEKNVSAQWYGDYTVYPEQPTVGSRSYDPVIYNSWDPNWRGFIGTALIVIYEEFGHLIGRDVQELIVESLYNNSIGDSYRVGGVDGDNLYPSYSNPSLMRAVVTGWSGRMCNDSNMTAAGEAYAQEIIDLFNLNNTLSEFNVPTYYGVSLTALTLWAKYLPSSSVMAQNGPRMVADIWTAFGDFYNAQLQNLAGPWDRSYGYDMNKYVAIMSLHIWSLVGRQHVFGLGSVDTSEDPWLLTHADDGEFVPLIAVLSDFHRSLVPASVIQSLTVFPGEHTVHRQAYTPPFDLDVRNISTWLSADLTIGADSYNQTVVGGASQDSNSFSPAIVHWHRNATAQQAASVGYFSLHPSQSSMQARVGPGALNLTYPAGNASSSFTFVVASNPLGTKRDVTGLADIDGVSVSILSGSTVNPVPEVAFCGLVGGTCSLIHNFEFWNLTFIMPANSTELPQLNLHFDLV